MWQEKSEKWKVQQEENLKSKKKQSIKRVEHGKSATFKQYNMKRVEHEKISKKSLTQKICNMKRMQHEKSATGGCIMEKAKHGVQTENLQHSATKSATRRTCNMRKV